MCVNIFSFSFFIISERFSDKTLCEKPEHELTAFILNRYVHQHNTNHNKRK